MFNTSLRVGSRSMIPSAIHQSSSYINEKHLEGHMGQDRVTSVTGLSESRGSSSQPLLKSLLEFNRPGRHHEVNLFQLDRLRQLVVFLRDHPQSRTEVWESGIVSTLINLLETGPNEVQQQANIALSLLGHVPPYEGHGLRILAIDGGGIRGLVPIILLHHLEQVSGLKINQMFDYVGGTSTGALVASLLFLRKVSTKEAETMYRELSGKIFKMNNFLGLGQLFLNQSFYDSSQLEKQIRRHSVVEKMMFETSCDPTVPKMSFVTTLVNRPVIEPFLFTNYQHHPDRTSNYRSRCNVSVWKAVMASTAAPGYFEEIKLENYILQDGSLLTNNPAAIALHEARLLWGPKVPIQCLISLGTGRFMKGRENEKMSNSTSLREKLTKVVASATDTEAVHTVLQDLLPSSTYFRFNPSLSQEIALDNPKPCNLQGLVDDANHFAESNQELIHQAAECLAAKKTVAQKAHQWYVDQWRRIKQWK